jgi:hypothetical protein
MPSAWCVAPPRQPTKNCSTTRGQQDFVLCDVLLLRTTAPATSNLQVSDVLLLALQLLCEDLVFTASLLFGKEVRSSHQLDPCSCLLHLSPTAIPHFVCTCWGEMREYPNRITTIGVSRLHASASMPNENTRGSKIQSPVRASYM